MRKLLTILFLVATGFGQSVVQNTTSGCAGSCALATSIGTGHALVFMAYSIYTGDSITVTDNNGNTYTPVATVTTGTNVYSCCATMNVYVICNPVLTPNNPMLLTMTHTGGATNVGGLLTEISGNPTTACADQHNTQINTTLATSFTSGSITPTVPISLVLGFGFANWGACGNPTNTGFYGLISNGGLGYAGIYRNVTSIAAYNPTFSTCNSGSIGITVNIKNAVQPSGKLIKVTQDNS